MNSTHVPSNGTSSVWEILNQLQRDYGFTYKWDKYWPVDGIIKSHKDEAVNGEHVRIELIRNRCYIWHDVHAHNNFGEVHVCHNHWLYYDSTINGFNNYIMRVVRPSIPTQTFIYIQVR